MVSLAAKLGAVSEQNKHTNKKPKQRGSSKAKLKPLLFFCLLEIKEFSVFYLLFGISPFSPKNVLCVQTCRE